MSQSASFLQTCANPIVYDQLCSHQPEIISQKLCLYGDDGTIEKVLHVCKEKLAKEKFEKVLQDPDLFNIAYDATTEDLLMFFYENLPDPLFMRLLSCKAGKVADFACKSFSHIWSFNFEENQMHSIFRSEGWQPESSALFMIQSLDSFRKVDSDPMFKKIRALFARIRMAASPSENVNNLKEMIIAGVPFLYVLPVSVLHNLSLHAVCLVLHLETNNILHIIQCDRGGSGDSICAHKLDLSKKEQKNVLIDALSELFQIEYDLPKSSEVWHGLGQKIGNCSVACLETALLALIAISFAQEMNMAIDAEEITLQSKALYKRWKRHSRKMAWENLQDDQYQKFLKENRIDLIELETQLDLDKSKAIRKQADHPPG